MDTHSLAMCRLKKYLPDFQEIKTKVFKSDYLSKHFISAKAVNGIIDTGKDVSIHNIEVERLLIKCCRENQCYPAFGYNNNVFELRTFTCRPTPEKFEYLYHQSNIPPEIILSEGLKIRYSFSLSKGFPPLLFLSKDCNWQGKYTYKVKIKQQVFFDTNLNHKCKTGNRYFCVKQSIPSKYIELVKCTTA